MPHPTEQARLAQPEPAASTSAPVSSSFGPGGCVVDPFPGPLTAPHLDAVAFDPPLESELREGAWYRNAGGDHAKWTPSVHPGKPWQGARTVWERDAFVPVARVVDAARVNLTPSQRLVEPTKIGAVVRVGDRLYVRTTTGAARGGWTSAAGRPWTWVAILGQRRVAELVEVLSEGVDL